MGFTISFNSLSDSHPDEFKKDKLNQKLSIPYRILTPYMCLKPNLT